MADTPTKPVEHTRTPWLIAHDAPKSDNGDIAIRTDRGRLIALVYAGPHAEANAAVIVSGPNLLRELEALLEIAEEGTWIGDYCEPDCECILHSVRAAIAKARGES